MHCLNKQNKPHTKPQPTNKKKQTKDQTPTAPPPKKTQKKQKWLLPLCACNLGIKKPMNTISLLTDQLLDSEPQTQSLSTTKLLGVQTKHQHGSVLGKQKCCYISAGQSRI